MSDFGIICHDCRESTSGRCWRHWESIFTTGAVQKASVAGFVRVEIPERVKRGLEIALHRALGHAIALNITEREQETLMQEAWQWLRASS